MQGGRKSCNFRPISYYIARKRLKIDEYMALYTAMHFTIIESSFYPCNIYCDCHMGVPREAKMCKKKVLKWQTFELTG